MNSVLDKPGPSGERQDTGDTTQKILGNPSNTNEVLPSSEKMQLPRKTGNKMKAIAFVAEAHKEILYKMLGDQADLEEMDTVFKRANTKLDVISFVPVKQTFYSKMSQENQTGLLTQIKEKPSKSRVPDVFFDYIASEHDKRVSGNSLHALITTYKTTIDNLVAILNAQGRTPSIGTDSWYNIENLTPTSHGEALADMVVEDTGRFFLQRK